jgi:hypothetical protein
MADTQRPRLRRALRIAAIVLAIPVVLVLAALVYLSTPPGRERVRAALEARLATRFAGQVEVGSARLSLRGLEASNVVIRDAAGAQAIALERLVVEPRLRELLRRRVVLRILRLEGLQVAVRRDEAGRSNFEGLYRRGELPEYVRIERFEIARSAVTMSAPDRIVALENLAIETSLEAHPREPTVKLDARSIAADLSVTRPGGLRVVVRELRTALEVDYARGTGAATLGKTTGRGALATAPDPHERSFEVSLPGATAKIGPGSLEAALDELDLAALAMQRLDVGIVRDDQGRLAGEQRVVAKGLRVDAKRLNAILDRELLAGDVGVEAQIVGPPGQLEIHVGTKTEGGHLAIDGRVDASDPEVPGYDVKAKLSNLATEKLLVPGATRAPPITGGPIDLHVVGKGRALDTAVADVTLRAGPLTIGALSLDALSLDAHLEKGVLTIEKLSAKVQGQPVELSGEFAFATRRVRARLAVPGDLAPSLARLKEAGVRVPPAATALRLDEGVAIEIEGPLDGVLSITVPETRARIAGGRITVAGAAKVVRDPERTRVEAMNVTVGATDVDLAALLPVLGRPPIEGLAGRASGRIDVAGTPAAPDVDADLWIRWSTEDAKGRARIRAHAIATRLDADVRIEREDQQNVPVLTAKASIPLAPGRKLAPRGAWSVQLAIPKRRLGEILALVPRAKRPSLPDAALALDVALAGTPAKPKGTIELDASGPLVTALAPDEQWAHLKAAIDADDERVSVGVDTAFALRSGEAPALEAHLALRTPHAPLAGLVSKLDWALTANVAPHTLGSLTRGRVKGAATAKVQAEGDLESLVAELNVEARGVSRDGRLPIDGGVAVMVGSKQTTLDLRADALGVALARLGGTVGLGGEGLVGKLRAREPLDPPLALSLTVPRASVAAFASVLAPIAPSLSARVAALRGDLSGAIAIDGRVRAPHAKGELAWDRWTSAHGTPGKLAVALDGSRESLTLSLVAGTTSPLRLDVSIPPATLLAARRDGGEVEIGLGLHGANVPLASLVPAGVATTDFAGAISSDLAGTVRLGLSKARASVLDGVSKGRLELVDASVAIAGAARRFEDVRLLLVGQGQAMRLERLSMREADAQNPARTLEATGEASWGASPRARLDLKSKDWLLFGGRFGAADAPRATLSADLAVAGELGGPMRKVRVDVRALELLAPDRFLRAHAPETLSLGDVVDVSEVPVGKLPGPPKAAPVKTPEPATEGDPPGPPTPLAPKPLAPKPLAPKPLAPKVEGQAPGLDVVVDIPKPIRVWQAPLDLVATGRIHLVAQDGGRKIDGKLDVRAGGLMVGGADHTLVKGEVRFDDDHPAGFFDLHFERKPHVVLLRDVSLSSRGEHAEVHMIGPNGGQQLVYEGLANGSLFELLAVNNTGATRFLGRPDLPASQAPQLPQFMQLRTITFMRVNLPHLLFLDRIHAFADPNERRDAHGRVENLEAEAYSRDGTLRWRAITRPPTVGESQGEVEVDRLFGNDERSVWGAGLRAGTRLGGGPLLFFEWSSDP